MEQSCLETAAMDVLAVSLQKPTCPAQSTSLEEQMTRYLPPDIHLFSNIIFGLISPLALP